jgi:hypothetical protein
MKQTNLRRILVHLIATAFVFHSQAQEHYTVLGSVPDKYNGTTVYLEKIVSRNSINYDGTGMPRIRNRNERQLMCPKIDSTVISNGHFQFRGTVNEPEVFFINIEGGSHTEVVLEQGTIYYNLPQGRWTTIKQLVTGTTLNDQLFRLDSIKTASLECAIELKKHEGDEVATKQIEQQVFDGLDTAFVLVRNNACNCVGGYMAYSFMDSFTDEQQEELGKIKGSYYLFNHSGWGRTRLKREMERKCNDNNVTRAEK